MDKEKVINGLRSIKTYLASQAIEANDDFARECFIESQKDIDDALAMLKEHDVPEELKYKMWNALYAEEDRFEKKFLGTDGHDAWFNIYRPWLQRGFEIAIKVIAHWEDPVRYERNGKKPTLVWPVSPNRNTENRCVVCGAVIPEGRYVCPNCESGDIQED